MAVAITVPTTGVSPYSVKLQAVGSGGGGTNSISRTTLVAAMVNGPLKTYLNSLSDAAWVLLAKNAKVLVTAYLVDTAAAAAAVAVDFISVTSIQVQVSGNFVAHISISFRHSAAR